MSPFVARSSDVIDNSSNHLTRIERCRRFFAARDGAQQSVLERLERLPSSVTCSDRQRGGPARGGDRLPLLGRGGASRRSNCGFPLLGGLYSAVYLYGSLPSASRSRSGSARPLRGRPVLSAPVR